jgi:hypothetical protein
MKHDHLEVIDQIKQTDWPELIKEIQDTRTPDGKKWTYDRIGEAVGLSKTSIGKLVSGEIPDPRALAGKKLEQLHRFAQQED